MEGKTRIEVHIPTERVLKEREKAELSKSFLDSLTENGIPEVSLLETYYVEKRSAAEPIAYLVFTILSGVASIATILTAIWTALRKKDDRKEVTVKIGDTVFVKIRGNMSQDELLQLIKEAKKPIGKRKE